MRISVIVAVLNGLDNIHQCLESIVSQSQDVELIIIDGGSTDGTLDILHRYDSYISYMEVGKDSGISDAFNRGLRHASGDLIAILNSDDYWESDALHEVIEATVKYPDVGIFNGWCRFLPESGPPYIKKPDIDAMKKYMSVCHSSSFIRRVVYEKVGEYREDYLYAMDSEWMHRALKMDVVFGELPLVLSNMRMGGVSDVSAKLALGEYRRSVVEHGIASKLYAAIYYWLHLGVKELDKHKYGVTSKHFIYRIFNRTVSY